MPDINERIMEKLSDQESEIMRSTSEQGYFGLALGLFHGKLGWVSWVIMLVQAALFVAGVWAAWQFFVATEVLAAVKWGISSAVLILMGSMMKLSFMPQLQADRVLRELKRIELLVLQRSKE